MGRLYVTTTLSPAMLDRDIRPIMETYEMFFINIKQILETKKKGFLGRVGHRDTADILAEKLSIPEITPETLFGRGNLRLRTGDRILTFVPRFKDKKKKELEFRYFYSQIK